MPSLLAQALAPWVGAVLLSRLGAHAAIGLLAGLAAVNLAGVAYLALLVHGGERRIVNTSS